MKPNKVEVRQYQQLSQQDKKLRKVVREEIDQTLQRVKAKREKEKRRLAAKESKKLQGTQPAAELTQPLKEA
jgi:hypothetical protein